MRLLFLLVLTLIDYIFHSWQFCSFFKIVWLRFGFFHFIFNLFVFEFSLFVFAINSVLFYLLPLLFLSIISIKLLKIKSIVFVFGYPLYFLVFSGILFL